MLQKTDDTLYVKSLVKDKIYEIPRGSGTVFSDDSKWAVYFINLPDKEQKKLRKDKKPVTRKVELLNLATGEKIAWDKVSTFKFSKGSGFLAVKKVKPDPKSKLNGTDLLLRNLMQGFHELIGNVNEYSFNKEGTLFAYTIDAAEKAGNGLYLIDLKSNTRKPPDNGEMDYSQLTWNEPGTALAVLKGKEKKGFEHKENVLVAISNINTQNQIKTEYDPSASHDFPKDFVISEKGTLSWSKDLNRVFFGIKKQENKPEKKDKDSDDDPDNAPDDDPEDDPDEVADVDIWHWNDDRIQSVQEAQAKRDRDFTYRSVFNIKNKRFFQLTDEKMRYITLTRDGNWGIGRDERAYMSDWKDVLADYYRVNTETGERLLFLKAQYRTMSMSPDSNNLLYWKDGHVWNYRLKTGDKVNLTKNSPVSFVNLESDFAGEKPAYGVSGWTKDGKSVILRHKYDLWLQPLDGKGPTNLTGGIGSENEIRFRYVRLNREERFIDLTKQTLLSAYGQWTKKSGFYLLNKGKLDKKIFEDKRFGRTLKSQKADKLLYTIESFVDFPNYYVSNLAFTEPQRITDANPLQIKYKWGHRILFDYTNNNGVRLQGTLAIPDDYKEGEKRPMLVNFYEKNSQNLHRHVAPRYLSSCGSVLIESVSKGYLYMQPDVHFNIGSSHSDMLVCVEAAVKKVIEV